MSAPLLAGIGVAILATAGLGSALIAAFVDAGRKDAEEREWGR